MEIIHNIPKELPQPCVATIGFFDGVHIGHRYLIQQVKDIANNSGLHAAVITFPVHPRKVMHSYYKPDLLTTHEEKVKLLSETNLDYCFSLDFTPRISHLSAFEFMQMIQEKYQVKSLVIGYDHRFGHNRTETFDDYCHFGKILDINIIQAQACTNSEEIVSSSVIRRLLHDGHIEKATHYLGYYYSLNGLVIHGHKIGRSIGYPTANLQSNNPEKLLPANGVYAVWVETKGKRYGGMLSIGYRPTINNGKKRSIEVHIFDFNEDIYNTSLQLYFVKRTRSEIRFNNKKELAEQLSKDAVIIQNILKEER